MMRDVMDGLRAVGEGGALGAGIAASGRGEVVPFTDFVSWSGSMLGESLTPSRG